MHLRQILTVYLHHFNAARPHRTLAQLAPARAERREQLTLVLRKVNPMLSEDLLR